MSKVDILRLDSVTTNDTKATALINTNFQNIQNVIETLLSRTGATPNYMDAVLDMNSYRIINTAAPTEDFDVVNLKYLRDYVGNVESLVADATAAAEAALDKANNAAASATSSAAYAQTAQAAAAQAAQDAIDAAAASHDISTMLSDPNLVAVGTDLRLGDSSLIKQVSEIDVSAVLQAASDAHDDAEDAARYAQTAEDAKDLAVAAADSASTFASSAQTASNLSQNWAIKTDGPVSDGEYSAKYWAQQASVGVVTDNKSINRNSSDELQTVGVIDQNSTSTALKEWSGTTQEYTAIQTKDTNTIYNVLEDGVYKGSTKIAAYVSSGGYHPDLLSFQWSDHLLNNVSWLRADTFSWQDGTVYEAAYDHLVDDIDGVTSTTETIGSYTITVYVASDGHKIVLADQAQTVADIYNETGVAWYFILDTTNQRFKLPRTKFGFTGLRDTVGKYVEAGLPNITGSTESGSYWHSSTTDDSTGPFYRDYKYGTNVSGSSNQNYSLTLNFDASRSSSIYGNSTTVQPPATEMYLYFYVGDYTQTALEQTAGLNAELFNGKLDTSTFNETPHIIETYVNGTSWYQIWSNKWCVQGGQSSLIADFGTATINLLKEFSNTDYTITKATMMPSNGDDTSYNDATCIRYATKTTSSFQIYNRGNADGGRYVAWEAKGYIS